MKESVSIVWHKVLDLPGLDEGRVMSVTAGTTGIALSRFNGQYGALDNRCPHQGGPLGEGSIEQGVGDQCWLRCPWYGWDFHPLTGQSPRGHGDGLKTISVEEREDGIVTGDGGFAQYMMELLTAVKHGTTELHNPNFADYVGNCGGRGLRVERADDLKAAMTEARDYAGPATVEVMADALLF